MVQADLQRRLDREHQFVRNNFLLTGRIARQPRDCGNDVPVAGDGRDVGRLSDSNADAARDVSFLVLALCGCHLGSGFHSGVHHRTVRRATWR